MYKPKHGSNRRGKKLVMEPQLIVSKGVCITRGEVDERGIAPPWLEEELGLLVRTGQGGTRRRTRSDKIAMRRTGS